MRDPFSLQELKYCVRVSDSRDYGVDLDGDRNKLIQQVQQLAHNNYNALDQFSKAIIRGKSCVVYADYSRVVLLRSISRYISLRFRVTPPNRDRVVNSVIAALGDASPFDVIRRDIASFYETVPITNVRDKLLFDTSLPRSLRSHLRTYFETHCADMQGCPRGVGLSSVLTELAMHPFDNSVRALPGVYRYFRYSDDILAFTYANTQECVQIISDILPSPMQFNSMKSYERPFRVKNDPAENRKSRFEYLGYSFASPNPPAKDNSPREIVVCVASDKIKKLKTRVVLSIKAHLSKPDVALLIKRLSYLTKNFKMSRTPVFYAARTKHIYSGIYFNYRRCGRYSRTEFQDSKRYELVDLDKFMQALLFSKKSPFSAGIKATVPSLSLQALSRLSFVIGYEKRLRVKVSTTDINKLRAAWRAEK